MQAVENIILLSWFFKICSIVTIYPKQILKQTILKENLLTNWIFLLFMQILCTDCRYLTNWMFVQARRQSWSLPSQDLPFPILADKPNNLSIILIILADENSKHLIVLILQCPSVLMRPQSSDLPVELPPLQFLNPGILCFILVLICLVLTNKNKPIFRDLYHI